MKLTTQITLITLVFCALSCGYMRDVSVYEPSKSISAFEQFPYKTLFTNSQENGVWGVKNNACKEVFFETKNSFIGKDHLHVKWNASKCNYIAVGLKWGNYKGKNLTPILESWIFCC